MIILNFCINIPTRYGPMIIRVIIPPDPMWLNTLMVCLPSPIIPGCRRIIMGQRWHGSGMMYKIFENGVEFEKFSE